MDYIKPILSLCIPTNGVKEWIFPVLNSIYSQDVNLEKFEVVITDNGGNNFIQEILPDFNYSNLHYFRSTEQGFVNQITCFKNSIGIFCKMLNHRSCLLPGALNKMIEVVERYKSTKPILYFSDYRLKCDNKFLECRDYDDFANYLHYWITWSAGVGIWDVDKSALDKISFDLMFPHIALMFDIRKSSQSVIWNEKFQIMLSDGGKGGYNVFYTFAVVFLNLMKRIECENKISSSVFHNIKDKLRIFLSELYYTEILRPTIHTFETSNIKESILVHYKLSDYYMIIFRAFFFFPSGILRMIKKHSLQFLSLIK